MERVRVASEVVLRGRLGQNSSGGNLLPRLRRRLDGFDQVDVAVQFEREQTLHVLDVEDEQVRLQIAHGCRGQQFVVFEELDELDLLGYFLPSGNF